MAFLIVFTREGRKRENWSGRPFPLLPSETGEETEEEGVLGYLAFLSWGTKRRLIQCLDHY